MKHTPGPWRIDPDNFNVYSDGLLAQVYGHTHNGERLANAQLIAAAPELLETLEMAQKAIKGGCETENDRQGLLDIISAIMAKAKGEL